MKVCGLRMEADFKSRSLHLCETRSDEAPARLMGKVPPATELWKAVCLAYRLSPYEENSLCLPYLLLEHC